MLGGHVDMMFDTLPSVLPLVQEGKLRALGVTTAERVPFLPDLPAIAETLPEFDVTSWLGIMVPSGAPPRSGPGSPRRSPSSCRSRRS